MREPSWGDHLRPVPAQMWQGSAQTVRRCGRGSALLRPCRPVCVCGACNGTVTERTLFVQQVIRWADNSVEVTATDFRGHVWRDTLVYPHGDICY